MSYGPSTLSGTPHVAREPVHPLDGDPGADRAFRLEDFVVGDCNRVTYLAACRLRDGDGDGGEDLCNPLFVYGKAGVGKTHLLQGVFHSYRQKHPRDRALHVTGEQFSNHFRASIRNGTVAEFRNRYRRLHFLLVDDIQALAGKAATQVEFLFTFEELCRGRGRIVIGADRHPNQMHSIKPSLLGRFLAGFVVRLDPPDIGTRIEILHGHCRRYGRDLGEDVLQLLAQETAGNVRELLGALTRVMAHATLCREEVDVEVARQILERLRASKPRQVTFRQIEKAVTRYFGIRPSDLRSRSRKRSMALPRQISMYLARQWGGYSLKEIGDRFGGKCHTTVTYSEGRVRQLLQEDPSLRTTVERLQAEILC